MTVKIVRMLNGEDVIAEVQEAYPDKEHYTPIGYMLTNPYQITIDCTAEQMFADKNSSDPQKINDLQLELFPWIPLSLNNRTLVVLNNVSTIYTPHPEVEGKWNTLVENHHNESVKTNNSKEPDVSDGGSD